MSFVKSCSFRGSRKFGRMLLGLLITISTLQMDSQAEYADVIINNNSDAEGVRPVIFPHWFHRIRFRCKVCHMELGFEMKAGGNDITMDAILDGKYCGACHDGEVAWSVINCDLCHSAKPGTESQIKGGHDTNGPGYY